MLTLWLCPWDRPCYGHWLTSSLLFKVLCQENFLHFLPSPLSPLVETFSFNIPTIITATISDHGKKHLKVPPPGPTYSFSFAELTLRAPFHIPIRHPNHKYSTNLHHPQMTPHAKGSLPVPITSQWICNEIYNAIMLRFKFGFIFRNYKFYRLWNQEIVTHLLATYTAYISRPNNSSYLQYFQPKRVTWPKEFISCYFVSINATDFGYWTHSLNTHQDDYTTRVPAVAYHQC